MRLRVAVVGPGAAGMPKATHGDLVDLRRLPDTVHLLLTPVALLDDAAGGGARARFVVVLGDVAGLDPGRVAAVADALGADLVVAVWSPDRFGAAARPTPSDDAGAVLRRIVDALVGGAVLGDALMAALGEVTPLIGEASLLGWTDLGALLDPFGGRGAAAEPPPDMAAPPDDAAPAPPPPPPPTEPSTADARWLQCTVTPDARAARAAERAARAPRTRSPRAATTWRCSSGRRRRAPCGVARSPTPSSASRPPRSSPSG